MRNERPRLLPSAERYVPAPLPAEHIDPNIIERAALYLGVAELLDPKAARPRKTTAAGQKAKP